MNSYTQKLMDYIGSSKGFIHSVGEKIALNAKRSGQSFKEYINDNENVSHISLVVYDILPLPLKFAMRYEKFDSAFVKNFSFIREKFFSNPKLIAAGDKMVEDASPPALKEETTSANTSKRVSLKTTSIKASMVKDENELAREEVEKGLARPRVRATTRSMTKSITRQPVQKSEVKPAKKIIRRTNDRTRLNEALDSVTVNFSEGVRIAEDTKQEMQKGRAGSRVRASAKDTATAPAKKATKTRKSV